MENSKLKYFNDVASKILKSETNSEFPTNEKDLVNLIFQKKFARLYQVLNQNEYNISIDDIPNCDNLYLNQNDDSIWIFGYGSLIFKPDFPYECRQKGYITGWSRRFYQNSIDHRGIPSRPGRVVTLVPATKECKVYGVVYKLNNDSSDYVLNHLDFREKNGYKRYQVKFYPFSNQTKGECEQNENYVNVIMYIATEENDSYAGHLSNLDDISEQIYHASGPSGPNREYVYKLAKAMKHLFPNVRDDHLFELERKLETKEKNDLERMELIKNRIGDILNIYYDNYKKNGTSCLSSIEESITELT